MPTKSGWINQLSTEVADAERRFKAATHRYGLAMLLKRMEPDYQGVNDLVAAAQTQAYAASINFDNATAMLGAGKAYIGDDGHLSDIQNGRIVAGTAKELDDIRSIAREPSVDAMNVRLSVRYATD